MLQKNNHLEIARGARRQPPSSALRALAAPFAKIHKFPDISGDFWMNESAANNFFHILAFWAHCVADGSSRHTVRPEVEKIKLPEIVFERKRGKRCKGENPHPVRAARYPGTLL